jgi:hypothetical protein
MSRKNKKAKASQSRPVPAGGPRIPFALIGLAAAGIAAVLAVAVVALVIAGGGSDAGTDDGRKTAVIVDQLQLTAPNPEFVSNARGMLSEAGYTVDYVAGSDVTVDLYRTLPAKKYDLVILRVHAGITTEVDASSGERTGTEYVSLFTGEPYDDTKYPAEQLNRLGKARYDETSDPLFGIGPEFVSKSMDGDFGGATVVMMGCDGLRSQTTAEAFLDRGASSFVSWTKPVSSTHTDEATEKLLQHLLVEGMQIEDAVETTAGELGPDPSYEGELRVLTG